MKRFIAFVAGIALLGAVTIDAITSTPKGFAAWLGIRHALAQSFQVGPGATIIGKLFRSGPPPTIAAGIGTPTMTAGSTDYAGQFTASATNGTTHTLTFSSAWTVAPQCWAVNQTGSSTGVGFIPSTTAIAFDGSGIAGSSKINYGCTSSF